MSDEPGVPEVATKEEVQKLTDEIGNIKELLRTLTVAVMEGRDHTPTGDTSRKAHPRTRKTSALKLNRLR